MRFARTCLALAAAVAAGCSHHSRNLAAGWGVRVERVTPSRFRLHSSATTPLPFETLLAVAADVSLSAGYRYFRLLEESTSSSTKIEEHSDSYQGTRGMRSYSVGTTTLIEGTADATPFLDTFAAHTALRRFDENRSAPVSATRPNPIPTSR